MKKILCAVAALALLAPVGAAGQDTGWWAPLSFELPQAERDGRQGALCRMVPDAPACRGDTARPDDRSDRSDDDRWETRREDRGRQNARERRRGNGPPFCRNGQGHPVHGKQWCRDKGWDTGSWVDVSWEDVILGRRGDRDRDRRRRGTLDRGGLQDVLGSVVFGRLESRARGVGGGALTGRIVEDRGRVLQIRAGDVPLAELLDIDGDGRADRVLLRGQR